VIATIVAYDLVFVVHLLSALSSLVILIVLRVEANAAPSASREQLREQFPDREDLAVRTVHLLPLTGLALVLLGGHDVSITQPWVIAGIVIYLVLARWIEVRTLPLERTFARTVQGEDVIPEGMSASLVRRIDVALGLLALALVAMIVQF
jgi:hypothetical protein